jgi:hypothetical protein
MLRTEGTFYARTEHGGHRVVADQTGFLVSWPSGEIKYPSARQTLIALTNRTPTPLPHHRDPKVSFDRYFRRGRYGSPKPKFDALTLFSPKLTVASPTVLIHSSPDLSIENPPKGIDLDRRGHEVRKLFYAGYGRRVVKYGYDPEDVLQDVFMGILVRNNGKCPFDPSKSSFGHYVHMVCGCIVSNYRRRYYRLERNEQFGVPSLESGEYLDVREADLAVCAADQYDIVEMGSIHNTLAAIIETNAFRYGADSGVALVCYNLMSHGLRKSEIAAAMSEPPDFVSKVMRAIRKIAAEWRDHVGL